MQSRLATRLNKIIHNGSSRRNKYFQQRVAPSSSSTGRTADPAEHAIDPEDSYPEERPRGTPTKEQPPIKENDPFVSPKLPHVPSPKLESNAVHAPIDPINQQRREYASSSVEVTEQLKDVDCVGMDGTPWPEDNMDRKTQIKERVKDDKEYFEHHKASPLSEMEMADTRKPVSQATDGAAGGGGGYFGDGDVVVWRPEQLLSAEETLLRTKMLWEANAMRGDPDSPHGRVLRALRGEYW